MLIGFRASSLTTCKNEAFTIEERPEIQMEDSNEKGKKDLCINFRKIDKIKSQLPLLQKELKNYVLCTCE